MLGGGGFGGWGGGNLVIAAVDKAGQADVGLGLQLVGSIVFLLLDIIKTAMRRGLENKGNSHILFSRKTRTCQFGRLVADSLALLDNTTMCGRVFGIRCGLTISTFMGSEQ